MNKAKSNVFDKPWAEGACSLCHGEKRCAKANIFSALWLLTCLCAVVLASCSSEDEGDTFGNGTARVQITINAREEGDLNTRAAGDTEAGITGEFMNDDLVVLLVDESGNVALKLTPDLSGNTAAQQGNLKSWVSDHVTLATGDYTAYAFANIDDVYYSGWSALISGITEGSAFDATTFSNIILNDPASKIDLTEHYIPLSATPLDVTVTEATTGISIGLDRLVAKVRATINAKAGVEVRSLTFSGYADNVSLIADATLPAETSYTCEKTVEVNETIPGDEGETGSLTVGDFYVNETRSSHDFGVDVTTNEKSGITYSAVTSQTKELPRNYIFPLTLQLNQFDLTISAAVYAAPIGYYGEVAVTPLTDTSFEVTIPTGWTFDLEVSGVDGATPTVCTWTLADATMKYIYFLDDGNAPATASSGTAVSGACSGSDTEGTYIIYIYVEWEASGVTYKRTYTLNVNVTNDWDAFMEQLLNSSASAAKGLVRCLHPEVLTLSNNTK